MIWIRTLLIFGCIALMTSQSVKPPISEKYLHHEICNSNSDKSSFSSRNNLNVFSFLQPTSGFNFASSYNKISTPKWVVSLLKRGIQAFCLTAYAVAISQDIDQRPNVAIIIFPFHEFW